MLSGDDCLENLFGRVRMQGAHNCGVDLKTLMDRLAAAMDLCHIFSIHPSWDQGHRRLNYSRMEHCDHLKPSSWKGELVASSCDPQATWEAGRAQAEIILHSHHVAVDLTQIFSQINVDMLHPFPDSIYPGISTDRDPSLSTLHELFTTGQRKPIDDNADNEYEDELDTEIDVNMDDILDEPPASAELQNTAGDDWIESDGQKFHKSSLLRIMFCSDFMRKSKERLQRVRAYTADHAKTSDEDSEEALLGVSLFVLGDLFATLVRTGHHVALAILQATGIDHKSRKVVSVSSAELSLEAADIKVSGQVLHLVPRSSTLAETSSVTVTKPVSDFLPSYSTLLGSASSEASCSQSLGITCDIAESMARNNILPTKPPDPPELSPTFIWIGDYIKFNALKAKKDKAKKTAASGSDAILRNSLILSSSSYMIEPLCGSLIGAYYLSVADTHNLCLNGLAETWQFDAGYLKDIARSILELVTVNKWKVAETGISFDDLFPYGASSGMPSSDDL